MKNIIIASVAVLSLGFSQTAFAASDYLLELGGVKGETTRAPAPSPTPTTATGIAMPPPPPAETTAGFDAFIKIDGIDGETKNPPPPPPPQPLETGKPTIELVKPSPSPATGGAQKGNVDMQWKVEEGEKAQTAGKVNIAVGDVNGDGIGDNTLPDPTETQAIYIKLGDVKGEGMGVTEASFSVRAKDLRDADEKTKEEVLAGAPTSTDMVRDGNDLALFLLREASIDPTIDSVEIKDGTMVIEHEAQGKFLGLFTMAYRERVEVDAEGEVRVARPWYSFLVNEDVDEEDIAAVAKEKKKEKPMQIESWSFGASNAGMYKAISNVLKTKHDTAKNSVGNIR